MFDIDEVRFRKHSRPQEPTMLLLRPNVLANLRQVSGAVRANAIINHRARTVTDTARRQVQRFVRPHPARKSTKPSHGSGRSLKDIRDLMTSSCRPLVISHYFDFYYQGEPLSRAHFMYGLIPAHNDISSSLSDKWRLSSKLLTILASSTRNAFP